MSNFPPLRTPQEVIGKGPRKKINTQQQRELEASQPQTVETEVRLLKTKQVQARARGFSQRCWERCSSGRRKVWRAEVRSTGIGGSAETEVRSTGTGGSAGTEVRSTGIGLTCPPRPPRNAPHRRSQHVRQANRLWFLLQDGADLLEKKWGNRCTRWYPRVKPFKE